MSAARCGFPRSWLGALLLPLFLLTDQAAFADRERLNGFVLTPSDVPVEEILAGGPAKDGIPALTHPPHLAAQGASWADDEIVIGVRARHSSTRSHLAST